MQTNFFGDAMFKSRLHGTCTSTATLRATMLRAAGIPTRLIQNLPLINRYEGDPEPLVEALRMRIMAKGYDWGQGGGGANHVYNEVFLNNHWIRVDNVINPGPFVGDKLFVKVYSLASWNDRADWRTPRPPEEGWNENRDFRTLEVVRRVSEVPVIRRVRPSTWRWRNESLSGDRRMPTGASRRRLRSATRVRADARVRRLLLRGRSPRRREDSWPGTVPARSCRGGLGVSIILNCA